MRPLLVSIFWIAFLFSGKAQLYDTAMWIPNGPVHSMVRYNNELIFGGDFDYVGKATGYGMAIDTTNGNPLFNGFPEVDGPVYAVYPDSWGGWYIGGDFTLVGGQPRKNLAHVSKKGYLYPNFNPSPDAPVRAIWVQAAGGATNLPRPNVYVGGDFTFIGGENRNYVACLNPYNGLPYLSWNPICDGPVRCIIGKVNPNGSGFMNAQRIFIGGDFTTVDNLSRPHLAEVTTVYGNVNTPHVLKPLFFTINSTVNTLYYEYGELFVGGAFTTVNSQQRKFLFKYFTGADSIDEGFLPDVNATVNCIARKGFVPNWSNGNGPPPPGRMPASFVATPFLDTTILIGGTFTLVGGQPRAAMAEVNRYDGQLQPLNISVTGTVNSIVWSSKTKDIFIGGNFLLVNGQPRRHFAKTDSLGALESLQFNVSDPVHGVSLNDSALFVGGEFVCRDGVVRNNIAAIDLSTKTASSFSVGADRYVTSLALTPNNQLLVGGNFLSLGGQPRSGIGGIDLTTSTVMPFIANTNGLVRSIAYINNKLYFGGLFTTVNSVSRINMGCVNFVTGQLVNWHPDANGTVNSIKAGTDRVWVGGYYSIIGGFTRNNIAVVDTLAGNCITAFSSVVNNGIYAIDVNSSRLFLGGWFTTVGGQPRDFSAMMDAITASVSSFDPNPDGIIRSIQQIDASTVVLGGDFVNVAGQPRNHMALVNLSNSTIQSLNPNLNRASLAYIKENNILYTGGLYTAISGRVHAFLTAINLQYIPGWEEHTDIPSFGLYPNPASSELTIHIHQPTEENYVTLYDLSGRELMRVETKGEEKLQLHTSSLTNGIYFVSLFSQKGSTSLKLVVSH